MPDPLLVFVTAMTPVGELRAAIPLGLARQDLPVWQVYALAVAGNLAPVLPLLLVLQRLGSRIEAMSNPLGTLLRWRTRQVHRWSNRLAHRYDILTVALLVGMPLPFTGAWTGTLAVWVLRIPPVRGLLGIALGVLGAGIIVTALALTGIELFTHIGS